MLKLAQRESDLLYTVKMKRVSKEERGAAEEGAELVRTLQHLTVAAATPEGQLPFLHQSLLHFLDLHIKSEGPWLC